MNADGSNPVHLTAQDAGDIVTPWSPDGKIAFQRSVNDSDYAWEVWVMNADGRDQRRLTDRPGRGVGALWSPDGSSFAASSARRRWLTPTRRPANPLAMRRAIIGLLVLALIAGGFGLGYVSGRAADDRRVPNLLGLGTEDRGQAAARRDVAAVGLRVGKVGWMACASDERGLVVYQNPSAGTIVPKGATVNIAIGGAGIGLFSRDQQPCLPGEQEQTGQPVSA